VVMAVIMLSLSAWVVAESDEFYTPSSPLLFHRCLLDPLALYMPFVYKNQTASALALAGSYGFFADESDSDWNLRRTIHARQTAKNNGGHNFLTAGDYLQSKWEPTTNCAFEERLGRSGDGGK
jgi:hypothetical protein